MTENDMPELGNLVYGNSRGEYRFPDRSIVQRDQWQDLLEYAGCDEYGHCYVDEYTNENGGFTNDILEINPYYWGDCTCDETGEFVAEHDPSCPCARHNFIYKPDGFWIDWYKYPFRDSYTSAPKTAREILEIFADAKALSQKNTEVE